VFSALGFYPVTPGVDQYVIGSPLFKKARIELENGHVFNITSAGNGPGKPYIQAAELNGNSYAKTYLSYEDLQKGGDLKFEMGEEPNMEWGSAAENAPYSLSKESID
jgi:putative alpha-1,2-mannosidase